MSNKHVPAKIIQWLIVLLSTSFLLLAEFGPLILNRTTKEEFHSTFLPWSIQSARLCPLRRERQGEEDQNESGRTCGLCGLYHLEGISVCESWWSFTPPPSPRDLTFWGPTLPLYRSPKGSLLFTHKNDWRWLDEATQQHYQVCNFVLIGLNRFHPTFFSR